MGFGVGGGQAPAPAALHLMHSEHSVSTWQAEELTGTQPWF